MAAIGHTVKAGHKCPAAKFGIASYSKAGDIYQIGKWQLFYKRSPANPAIGMYIVCRVDLTGDYYDFTNYNCAATKLTELGQAA